MVRLSSAKRIRCGIRSPRRGRCRPSLHRPLPGGRLESLIDARRRTPRDRPRQHPGGRRDQEKTPARLVAHAVQEIKEVFRGDVARRPGCVRAPAETTRRGVEDPHALPQPFGHVRERRSARVVEVERETRQRHARVHAASDDLGHLCGNADADRVADRHLVATRVEQPPRDASGRGRRDRALVRAAETARHVPAYAHPGLPCSPYHRLKARERLVDRGVDVLPVERLRRRREDRDLSRARRLGPVEPLLVRDENRITHARAFRDPPEDLFAVCELRDRLRRDEGRRLHDGQPSGREAIHERDLYVRRNRRRHVLKAIARADLDDRDARRVPAISTRTSPRPTICPSETRTRSTAPSFGARTACSIFIASTTTRTSPFETEAPAATRTAAIRPGIGASSEGVSSAPRAARRERADERRYVSPRNHTQATSPSRAAVAPGGTSAAASRSSPVRKSRSLTRHPSETAPRTGSKRRRARSFLPARARHEREPTRRPRRPRPE